MTSGQRQDVPPVSAATVIVVRDGPRGLETLLLHRAATGAFGGMWVFPGGKVDDQDTGDDALDRARAAAVREAEEEAGLVLEAVNLVPLSHWLPPSVAPQRFSTWFFIAAAADVAEVVIDGHEIGDHSWESPAGALARRDAGEIELAPPTWVSLHWLARHDSVEQAMEAARAATAEHFVTRMVQNGGTRVALWRGDVAYDDGDVTAPGSRHRLEMSRRSWRYERSADGAE